MSSSPAAAAPAAIPVKKRNVAFDAYRGIAIFFVVLAHSVGYGWDFIHHDSGQWNFYWSVFLRQVMLCALPAFLFVSGYWLGNIEFPTWASYGQFLRKRVSRVAIPYVLWSVVFYTFYAWRAHDFSLYEFAVKLVLGQAEGPYFFIVMLLQFYLLTPVFVYVCKHRHWVKWVVVAHALFLIFLYAVRYLYLKDLSFSYVKLPFLSWLSFYLMGIYLRRYPHVSDALTTFRLAALALVFLALSMVEGMILIGQGYFEFGISDVKFSCFGYSFMVLLLMFRLRDTWWPRVLVLLGDYAFGIFFVHGIILRNLMGKLKGVTFIYEFQPAFQFLATGVTLVITCGIIYATRKAIGTERARSYLGF